MSHTNLGHKFGHGAQSRGITILESFELLFERIIGVQIMLYSILRTVCVFVTFLSLSSNLGNTQEADPWYIALAGPLSGESAHLGSAMVDGVRFFIDGVNSTGGVHGRTIEIVLFDDENSATKAEQVAQEIGADPRFLAVIGHRTSGASIAASPFYLDYEIPAISGTATADSVTMNPWYFRAVYNNSQQAEFIANYMNRVLGFQQATLVSTFSAYSDSLSSAFINAADKLPLEITHQFSVDQDSPDIDLDMADIVAELSLLPDSGIIFLAMSAREAAYFVREMRLSGFVMPVFGPDSINQQFPNYFEPDPILKLRPGDFSDQIYATTSMIWDVANEKAVRFKSDFSRRFGGTPDAGHALYYDTASVLVGAMKNANLSGIDSGQDRKALRQALSEIDSPEIAMDGITGKIYFDSSGNAIKSVPVGIFELGEFISAPVQLQPVINPTMVPDFSDKLEEGKIIPLGSAYQHKTQIVYIGIDINEITNLNTADGTYIVDFFIWLRFRGDLDISKIQFTNATTPIKLENLVWDRERNGMRILTFKVRHLFRGDFEFKDYPFDKQKILLEVRHENRLSESLKFVIDRLGMKLSDDGATLVQRMNEEDVFRSSKGWRVEDARVFQDIAKTTSTLGETRSIQTETEVNFSRVKMEIEISRLLTSYSTTIMLPIFVLFIIGFLLFAIPIKEIPPRLSGGILVLVTVALLRARLSEDLPNIGYLVAIDFIFFALQIIMWFGILISVISFWVFETGNAVTARRINLFGAIVYPLPLVGVALYILLTTAAFN